MNEAGHYLLCLPKMPSDKKLKKKKYKLLIKRTYNFSVHHLWYSEGTCHEGSRTFRS